MKRRYKIQDSGEFLTHCEYLFKDKRKIKQSGSKACGYVFNDERKIKQIGSKACDKCMHNSENNRVEKWVDCRVLVFKGPRFRFYIKGMFKRWRLRFYINLLIFIIASATLIYKRF